MAQILSGYLIIKTTKLNLYNPIYSKVHTLTTISLVFIFSIYSFSNIILVLSKTIAANKAEFIGWIYLLTALTISVYVL